MATCYTTDILFIRKKNLDQQSFSIKLLKLRFHTGQFIFSSYLFLT